MLTIKRKKREREGVGGLARLPEGEEETAATIAGGEKLAGETR